MRFSLYELNFSDLPSIGIVPIGYFYSLPKLLSNCQEGVLLPGNFVFVTHNGDGKLPQGKSFLAVIKNNGREHLFEASLIQELIVEDDCYSWNSRLHLKRLIGEFSEIYRAFE